MTTDRYDPLRAAWPGIDGADPLARLGALATLTVAGDPLPAPMPAIMTYLRDNNLWLPIKAAATSNNGAAALVDYNGDARITALDLVNDPAASRMLADLVAGALMKPDHVAALQALGTPIVPKWQAPVAKDGLGLSSVPGLPDLVAAGLLTVDDEYALLVANGTIDQAEADRYLALRAQQAERAQPGDAP